MKTIGKRYVATHELQEMKDNIYAAKQRIREVAGFLETVKRKNGVFHSIWRSLEYADNATTQALQEFNYEIAERINNLEKESEGGNQ